MYMYMECTCTCSLHVHAALGNMSLPVHEHKHMYAQPSIPADSNATHKVTVGLPSDINITVRDLRIYMYAHTIVQITCACTVHLIP